MKSLVRCWLLGISCIFSVLAHAQSAGEHKGHLTVDSDGAVMNENLADLPRGCDAISVDYQFTIHAGKNYAEQKPGLIFGMSEHELAVTPCSRIELTFVNEDQVRHQWMVHGLPRYLYPAGMFHIEAEGGQTKTGTLIVPAEHQTYLIHCDMAQHMEKGMRGQLVVGAGSGDLWDVPGVSDKLLRDNYGSEAVRMLAALAAVALGILAVSLLRRFV